MEIVCCKLATSFTSPRSHNPKVAGSKSSPRSQSKASEGKNFRGLRVSGDDVFIGHPSGKTDARGQNSRVDLVDRPGAEAGRHENAPGRFPGRSGKEEGTECGYFTTLSRRTFGPCRFAASCRCACAA